MCKVSDKLKLCTCTTVDLYRLRHFWVLHRFVEGKNDIVVGEILLPYNLVKVDHRLNTGILLSLLNTDNIFDTNIQISDKDLLHISFTCGEQDRLNYGFEFKKKKWKEVEYNALSWMWHHEEIAYGKIKNALKK